MQAEPDTQETEDGADTDAAAQRADAQPGYVSPLDASLRRPNQRQQRSGPDPVWDAEAISTPSPTLNPQNLTTLPDYEEHSTGAMAVAVTAMEALHEAASQLIAARQGIQSDPTLTPAAMVLALDGMLAKIMPAATRKVDAANAALAQSIATQEAELKAPVRSNAAGPYAAEVRSVVRAMKTAERVAFIQAAIAEGDAVVAGAVLGAPPALSGLDATMVAALSEQWQHARSPIGARRLALLKEAAVRLERAGGVYLTTLEAQLGSRQRTVAKLKAAQTKARTVIGAIA